jgi:putative endonuclease
VTGEAGERAAERFLRKAGYRIVARNVRYTQGEVDLVALERRSGTLCFVEVRSRTVEEGAEPAISPEASVTLIKRRRVIRAARRFALERKAMDRVLRFDVVTVRFAGNGHRAPPDIRHYPGAFDARGRLL